MERHEYYLDKLWVEERIRMKRVKCISELVAVQHNIYILGADVLRQFQNICTTE